MIVQETNFHQVRSLNLPKVLGWHHTQVQHDCHRMTFSSPEPPRILSFGTNQFLDSHDSADGSEKNFWQSPPYHNINHYIFLFSVSLSFSLLFFPIFFKFFFFSPCCGFKITDFQTLDIVAIIYIRFIAHFFPE